MAGCHFEIVLMPFRNKNYIFNGGTDNLPLFNHAPRVKITSPSSGYIAPVGTTINLVGNFIDGDIGDSQTATWTISNENWSSDYTFNGTITGNAVNGSLVLSEAGVYFIKLTVTDIRGASGNTTTVTDGQGNELPAYVVVYNPEGGFVTGGGWIYSEAGSLLTDPVVEGKASFGFVAKYIKGNTVPQGNTEFQFQAGNFRFKSTSYEWLVVAGTKAMFKGSGSIGGREGSYAFLLTAFDEVPDKFRIKIWDPITDATIYDNKRGQADSVIPTAIGGGSIIVHKN